jgi:type IV secretory pathway VirB10-like protein
MRKFSELALFVVLAAALAASQQPRDKGQTSVNSEAPPPNFTQSDGQNPSRDFPSTRAGEIAANTDIHAALDTPLSSRTARAGDRFTATISQPVRDRSGAPLIPSGSRLMGEVADEAPMADRGRSPLNIRFTEITLPDGQKVAIASSLSIGDKAGKEVNLPAQTPLVIRLQKPAMVPASGK